MLSNLAKAVLKIAYNIVLGGAGLLLINLTGSIFGFTIAFNAVSAFIAGTLGIPGIALLAVLKFIFK